MTDVNEAARRLDRRAELLDAPTVRDIRTVLDALAEAREARGDIALTAAKYWQRMTEAVSEMHARELHHFEEEQARAKAEAELASLRARVDEALATCDLALAAKVAGSSEGEAAAAGTAAVIQRILSTPTEKEQS